MSFLSHAAAMSAPVGCGMGMKYSEGMIGMELPHTLLQDGIEFLPHTAGAARTPGCKEPVVSKLMLETP